MDNYTIYTVKQKIEHLSFEELIVSKYWKTIYNDIYLTHSLLKTQKVKDLNCINKDFFKEDIICKDLIAYEQPNYSFIPKSILNSKSFWINVVENDPTNVSKIPEDFLCNNADFCLWVVNNFSKEKILQYFSEKLKSDFHLTYFSVLSNINNFFYTSKQNQNNPIIYEVIYNTDVKHLEFFKHSGENIRSNYKFLKQAVMENPIALAFSPLKNDSGLFFDLLNYSPNILQFAGEDIKNNENCVKSSIIQNPLSIEWANQQFKSSTEFVLSVHQTLIDNNLFNTFSKLLDPIVFSDYDIVNKYFSLIAENSAYSVLGNNILNDYDIMSKFVIADVSAFQFVSDELKNDISFIKQCYKFYEKTNPLGCYDTESEQSKLFYYLNDNSLNDINFINELYTEFKSIFKPIIFAVMQHKKIPLANLLKNDNESNFEHNISVALGKLELHKKLEHDLNPQHKIIKQKI